jgi:hypothetical protein
VTTSPQRAAAAITALEMQLTALRMSKGFVANIRDISENPPPGIPLDEWRRLSGWHYRSARVSSRVLQRASAYYWVPAIARAVHDASRSYPLDEAVLRPDDRHALYGWFWCDEPFFTINTLRNPDVPVQGIMWGLIDMADEGQSPEYRLEVQGFTLRHGLPTHMLTAHPKVGRTIEIGRSDVLVVGQEGFQEDAAEMLRFLLAASQWLTQRILVGTREPASRPLRRRWERFIAAEPPALEVVSLRERERQPREDSEHHPVDWHCRWVVSGHWRNQYHPSNDTHVPTWILPHLKGPADKPLKPPATRVFKVER